MASLFGDSHENYATADLLLKYTNFETSFASSSNFSITTSAVVTGTYGMRLALTGSTSVSAICNVNKTVTAGSTTFIDHFYFRYSAAQSSPIPIGIRAVKSGGSIQCQMMLNRDGTLSVARGSSSFGTAPAVLGTTSSALLAGNWYHIQWKVKIHGSTGTVDVKINNVSALSLTGKNTDSVGSVTWNGLSIGLQYNYTNALTGYAYSAVNLDYDDTALCDTAGSANNDFLGVVAGYFLKAETGNGAVTGFTPSSGSNHGDMVKEQNEDGDTTYNSASSSGTIDTYTLEGLTGTPTIRFVQSVPVVRKTDTGARTVANVLRISATNYVGADIAPNTTYSQLLTTYDVSPATSSAFTYTEVNAMEGGLKITA